MASGSFVGKPGNPYAPLGRRVLKTQDGLLLGMAKRDKVGTGFSPPPLHYHLALSHLDA